MPTLSEWLDGTGLPPEKVAKYRAKARQRPPEPHCRRLGPQVGEVACPTCKGQSVRLKTFRCDVFGVCILADRKVEGTPSCVGCLEFRAVSHETVSRPAHPLP
jgi:hypothetical protein